MSGSSSTIRIPEHGSRRRSPYRRRRRYVSGQSRRQRLVEHRRSARRAAKVRDKRRRGRYKEGASVEARRRVRRSRSARRFRRCRRRAARRRPNGVPDALEASTLLGFRYRIEPNITYLTVNGWNARLDLYLPLHADRARADVRLLPRRRLGDRLEGRVGARGAALPGDGVRGGQRRLPPGAGRAGAGRGRGRRCALRWVFRHAQQYSLDPARIVAGGNVGRRPPGAAGGDGAGLAPAWTGCARATRSSRSRRS